MRKAYYPRVRIITIRQFNDLLCKQIIKPLSSKQIIEPLSIDRHPYSYQPYSYKGSDYGVAIIPDMESLLGKRVVIQHYNSRTNLYNFTECSLTVSKWWLTVPNWMLRRNYVAILKEYNKDK